MNQDLPPQAYTRETLQEAFNWLQEQPEPVRATVHTPERLVSLYQKSQRMNEYDAPVSSKKFIDDLKNLATSLDQFGGHPKNFKTTSPPPPQTSGFPFASAPQNNSYSGLFKSPQPSPMTVYSSPENHETFEQNPVFTPTIHHSASEAHQGQVSAQASASTHYESTQTTETKKSVITTEIKSSLQGPLSQDLDAISLQRVKEVKARFNLGSEAEALRLLVSLGFEKFSQFP